MARKLMRMEQKPPKKKEPEITEKPVPEQSPPDTTTYVYTCYNCKHQLFCVGYVDMEAFIQKVGRKLFEFTTEGRQTTSVFWQDLFKTLAMACRLYDPKEVHHEQTIR